MTLSPMVNACAAVYEQEHGQKPPELTLRVWEHIENVGRMLAELGRNDALEGKSVRPAEDFPLLVRKVFSLDQNAARDMVQEVANVWQSDYMNSYNEAVPPT